MTDPIVEEIHKIRADYAEKFDLDINAMFEDLREKQNQSKRKIVSFTKNKKIKRTVNDKKTA